MDMTKLGIDPSKYEITDIDYDAEVGKCVAGFNRRGISLMDYPPSTRHRAFEIENQITDAANDDDPVQLMDLLKQWRQCFH